MARKPRKAAQAEVITYAILNGRLVPRNEVLAAEQKSAETSEPEAPEVPETKPLTKAQQKKADAKAAVVASTFKDVDLDEKTEADLETLLTEAFAEAKVKVTPEEVSEFVATAINEVEL